MLRFLFSNQIYLGMLLALCFFCPWKRRRSYFWIRFPVLCVGTTCLFHFVKGIPTPFTLLLFCLSAFFIVLICFDCDFKYALFAVTNAYCIQHITSKATYILWNLLAFNRVFEFSYMYPVVLLLLAGTNAIAFVSVYFFVLRPLQKQEEIRFDSMKVLFASTAFLCSAVFLSYYAEKGLSYWNKYYLLSYCCLNGICILVALTVLFINYMNSQNKKLEAEKQFIEQLLKKGEVQYERAKLNIERINIRYHDLKQLSDIIDDKEQAKLKEEMKTLQAMYYTGNKASDITLSEKALACAKRDIQFVCSVDGSCLNMLTPYQIYTLLGNAIDNAVECLKKVEDEEKRVVRVNIGKRGDMSVIHIENYTPFVPHLEDGIPQTTKKETENHGWGIKSIRNIAEEHGGSIHIFVEDDVFHLSVMLPTLQK